MLALINEGQLVFSLWDVRIARRWWWRLESGSGPKSTGHGVFTAYLYVAVIHAQELGLNLNQPGVVVSRRRKDLRFFYKWGTTNPSPERRRICLSHRTSLRELRRPPSQYPGLPSASDQNSTVPSTSKPQMLVLSTTDMGKCITPESED